MTEPYKDDLIIERCKNKRVLHVGATDTPYHLEKAKKNKLLHQRLQVVCKELVGIDIDKQSIEELKQFGINIFHGDILTGKYEVDFKKHKFDFIVLGDIIEHLENPGLALDNIKKLMSKNTKIILTVPNAFSYMNIKTPFTGKEKVHPDHVFWPSYKTMLRLFESKNLKTDYFSYCFWDSSKEESLKGRLAHKLILKRMKHLLPCMFFILKRD